MSVTGGSHPQSARSDSSSGRYHSSVQGATTPPFRALPLLRSGRYPLLCQCRVLRSSGAEKQTHDNRQPQMHMATSHATQAVAQHTAGPPPRDHARSIITSEPRDRARSIIKSEPRDRARSIIKSEPRDRARSIIKSEPRDRARSIIKSEHEPRGASPAENNTAHPNAPSERYSPCTQQ
jgi:hypothetical protein